MAYPSNEEAAFMASKDAILSLMRNKKCTDVPYVDQNANGFDDIVPLIFTFAKTFDCDPAYLVSILQQIPADVLISRHVYYNQNIPAGQVNNPRLIVLSNIAEVHIIGASTFQYYEGIEVHNASGVGKIIIEGNIRVKNITISSGSQVDEIEIQDGSIVETIHLKACNEVNGGRLLKLFSDDQLENLSIDVGAVFGGIFCKPQLT